MKICGLTQLNDKTLQTAQKRLIYASEHLGALEGLNSNACDEVLYNVDRADTLIRMYLHDKEVDLGGRNRFYGQNKAYTDVFSISVNFEEGFFLLHVPFTFKRPLTHSYDLMRKVSYFLKDWQDKHLPIDSIVGFPRIVCVQRRARRRTSLIRDNDNIEVQTIVNLLMDRRDSVDDLCSYVSSFKMCDKDEECGFYIALFEPEKLMKYQEFVY